MKNTFWLIMAGYFCLWLPQPAEAKDIEHVIRCESNDFGSEHCRLPIAPGNAEIKEIKVVKQLSTKPCIEGKTWEANYDGITVTNGCRADFRVVYQTEDRDRHRRYEDEDRDDYRPSVRREEPAEIVVRAFEDVLNRQPTRKELQEYQYLILERNWSERDVRKDLRRRSYEGRY